jgi:hypothetical protein
VTSLALVFLVPGAVNTPGCAHRVSITSDCQALMAAGNEAIFSTHTLPLIVAICAGYAAILAVAAVRSRRSR